MPLRPITTHSLLGLALAMTLAGSGQAWADSPEGLSAEAQTGTAEATTNVPAPSTQSPTSAGPPVAETESQAPAAPATPPTAAGEAPATPAPQVASQHPQPRRARLSHARRPGRRGAGPLNASAQGASNVPLAPFSSTAPVPGSFGGALAGMPSFFINNFAIPPFLLPIYQAAGADYGIPWQVLAAINEVETDYGHDLSVSSVGAEGWMQFMPSTWRQYGTDVNNDGFEDPYNPADAIFAAARYLKAAGGDRDIRRAIFAYNHSRVYVRSVLLRARLLGGMPPQLLDSVTGLTEARFPVYAPSHYSDGFATGPDGAQLIGTAIYSQADAPAVAVQDARVTRMGDSPRLGNFVSLQDDYGNVYTYASLGRLARVYPVLEGAGRFSLHPLHPGAQVLAGTVLGHLASQAQPHLVFQVRPAGSPGSQVDPKPILDSWVNLEASSAVRTKGAKTLERTPTSSGQALLESKRQLMRAVSRDRHIRLAACERRLIAGGHLDRRLLADLEFLSSTGLRLNVSASSCPKGGGAVGRLRSLDVSRVEGAPVVLAGRSASGAIVAVRRLLRLQGPLRPLAIQGPSGLPKADAVRVLTGGPAHVRISFDRAAPTARAAGLFSAGLSPEQWSRLVARLGQVPDPSVSAKPSPAAIPAPHGGANG